ncbi:MAG: hypothetical protein HY820_31745 [Acidobacteria bacterium]|nr:hypothetical protein [Acidobacteriota bacterium]
MPFEPFTPRPFTAASVRGYAPDLPGVYGITNSREWIYIGEAENLCEALLLHLNNPGTALMRKEPTGFVFELCEGGKRPGRQDRLVMEYEPKLNRMGER